MDSAKEANRLAGVVVSWIGLFGLEVVLRGLVLAVSAKYLEKSGHKDEGRYERILEKLISARDHSVMD